MPKKPGARPTRATSFESAAQRRRPVRPSSRPAAEFPIGATEVVRPATVQPTPEEALRSVPVPPPTRPLPDRSVSPPVRPAPGRLGATPTRMIRSVRPNSTPAVVDYSYVVSDLRRIALLAVLAFAILGGLTFVVH